MEVEVDIYSGRPNPRFSLSPPASAELMRRIESLSPLGGQGTISEALGYRGFRVVPGDEDPSVEEIVASNGVVLVRQPDAQERIMADRDRSIERWLAQAGASALDSEVVSVLRGELSF